MISRTIVLGLVAAASLSLTACGPSAEELAAIEAEKARIQAEIDGAKAHNILVDVCAQIEGFDYLAVVRPEMDWAPVITQTEEAQSLDPTSSRDVVNLVEDLSNFKKDFEAWSEDFSSLGKGDLAGALDLQARSEDLNVRSEKLLPKIEKHCDAFASEVPVPEGASDDQ